MFLAALFILAKKLWYIHTMEYYSAIERNKLAIQAIPQTNLKDAMLDERNLTQESILYGSTYMKF